MKKSRLCFIAGISQVQIYIQSVKGHRGVKGEGMGEKEKYIQAIYSCVRKAGKKAEEVKDIVESCVILYELLDLDICY